MSESLRDQLSAAFDKSTAPEEEQVTVEDTVVEASPEVEVASEEVQPEVEEVVEEEIELPDNFSAEDKEVLKSIDSRAREFIVRRHKQMEAAHTKKQQAVAEERKRIDGLLKTIEPHDDLFNNLGLKREEAISELLHTARILHGSDHNSKAAVVQKLIQDFGIQLDAYEPNESRHDSHEVSQLKADIEFLKRQQEEMALAPYRNEVVNFENQKDSSGNLKYPHFREVEHHMKHLIETASAQTLEEAYIKAIRLEDALHNEAALRYNEQKEAETRKRVEASKRAGFNVKSGSVAQLSDPKEDLTLRESLGRNYDAQLSAPRI